MTTFRRRFPGRQDGWTDDRENANVPGLLKVSTMRTVMTIAIVALAAPLLAAGQQVRLENACIPPGQTGEVAVTLDGLFGLGGLDLLVNYDPVVLRFDSVVEGTTGESVDFTAACDRPGQLRIAMISSARLAGRGTILRLRFTAVGLRGSASKLTIAAGQAISAETQLRMSARFVDGLVTVAAPPVVPPPPPTTRPPPTPIGQPTLPPGEQPVIAPTTVPAAVEWQLDGELLLNLSIAAISGLVILVLLIALYYALSRRRPAAAAANQDTTDPSSTVCPSCGQAVAAAARFCPQCGGKLR